MHLVIMEKTPEVRSELFESHFRSDAMKSWQPTEPINIRVLTEASGTIRYQRLGFGQSRKV